MAATHFDEYTNLQHVKHSLIRSYLGGWFPKMVLGPNGAKKVLYFDTHAGKGKFAGGQEGSPIVALKTIVNHVSLPRLRGEVQFAFMEEDEEHLACLKSELAKIPLPANVKVFPAEGNCFEILDDLIQQTKSIGKIFAPSFVFCDPFGFSIPGNTLKELMTFPKTELFVNIMWRELDMAIIQARNGTMPGMVPRLNSIFTDSRWQAINANDFDERAEQCVQTFRQMTNARWATYIRMLGDNGATRYFLLHLTNHDAGRDLMKTCIWSACPDGGYYARRNDDPRQQYLITPEPDLQPLEKWTCEKLSSGPKRWKQLHTEVREKIWLEKHVNEVVRDSKKRDVITASGINGKKFAATNNPLLELAQGR